MRETCSDVLRPYLQDFEKALVLFDRMGCGREKRSREELQAEVEERLDANGWAGRTRVIVMDPELEVWAFSRTSELGEVLGWPRGSPGLRQWPEERGFTAPGVDKPADPKAAFEAVLRELKKPRSSSIYFELARRVSVRGCRDPASGRLAETLAGWFPA